MNLVKKKWKYIVLTVLSVIFLSIMISVILNRELMIDSLSNVVLNSRNDLVTSILKSLTILSDPDFLIVLSIVIFFFIKGKREKFDFVFNISFITLVNQLLKRVIKRPRPTVEHLIRQGGYSFPSGHSMASVAFYGYLIYLLWKTKWNKKIKYIGTVVLITLIFLICFSRIYLGVHYISDVLAGVCLSLIHLIIYVGILKSKES